MDIELGQIWVRVRSDENFPKKSWKVRIIGYEEGIVYHTMIEYDGETRKGGQVFEMKDNDFLRVYRLSNATSDS